MERGKGQIIGRNVGQGFVEMPFEFAMDEIPLQKPAKVRKRGSCRLI